MGCSSSSPVNETEEQQKQGGGTRYDAQEQGQQQQQQVRTLPPPPAAKAAALPASVSDAQNGSPGPAGVNFRAESPPSRPSTSTPGADRKRGVSFAGTGMPTAEEESSSNRPSRTSRKGKKERSLSFVGADLQNIMDEQGMLHEGVSRQLSSMSHYSVRSDGGNVIIEPEQPRAPFELLGLIGRGGFGNVYLADWEDQKVAVKVMQGQAADALQPEEQKWEARKERMAQMEAVLMSAINHPNIVNTFKVISHSGDDLDADLVMVERRMLANAGVNSKEEGLPSFEWHIIMEYCDRGSLSRDLSSFKTVGWDVWASIEVLKETVQALIFLHENQIIHGDLKAANVLLSSCDQDRRGWIGKLSDFGLARVMAKDQTSITTRTFGTVTHMPSELLSKGLLLPSSDVYALGVLMWEIFTGEKVFKQLSDAAVVIAVVTKKARPPWPADTPPRYRFLAEKCWNDMHELRPTLPRILRELEALQERLCPEGEESPLIPCQVFPTRKTMLDQYKQYLESKQGAAQKAKEREQARAATTSNSGAPLTTSKSALKPSKSLRFTEARFDEGVSKHTREGAKQQEFRIDQPHPTTHKSMHVKGIPAGGDDDEELGSPVYQSRLARSMNARRTAADKTDHTNGDDGEDISFNEAAKPPRKNISKAKSFSAASPEPSMTDKNGGLPGQLAQ